ncbi:Secreted protein OS=Corynebacterium variabile OX=1727 GN=CVA01_28920 PE=4 SV=1 [Corynebacterium variabile]
MLPDTLDALIVLSIPLTLTWATCAAADWFYDRSQARLHHRPARRATPGQDFTPISVKTPSPGCRVTPLPGAVGGVAAPVRVLPRPVSPFAAPSPEAVAPVLNLNHRRRVRTVSAPVTGTERPEVAA